MQAPHRVPPEVQGIATPIHQPPEVYNLHGWAKMDHPQRIAVLRRIARGGANNPRVIETAIAIVRGDPRIWGGRGVRGAEARDYAGQTKLLLLHDRSISNNDGIKNFFHEVHEVYVKAMLNPLYTAGTR
ncbi:MAG: hypothetical protein P1V36_15835, partial [Planctomycetota bacterium]|nr:hypothetical protein [Planctomycetota bacterium]